MRHYPTVTENGGLESLSIVPLPEVVNRLLSRSIELRASRIFASTLASTG